MITTVSAIVLNSQDQFLAQRRTDQPGYWPIVGKVDRSDEHDALLKDRFFAKSVELLCSELTREIEEEVFIDSEVKLSRRFFTYISDDKRYVNYCFLGIVEGIPDVVTLEDKHYPFEWVDRSHMAGLFEGENMMFIVSDVLGPIHHIKYKEVDFELPC